MKNLVKAKEVAGSVAQSMDMSIMGLMMQADFVVKIVMIVLLIASFWCWAIIFDKYFTYKKARYRMDKFEKIFWSGHLLDQLYERIKDRADHPFAMLFVAAMNEWNKNNAVKASKEIKDNIKERISKVMFVAQNRGIDKLQKNLSFLATVGSAAPFIGLFGTVWGIMSSFQSIAISKNTTLAVVAPGIAEALLATAMGLFAAIPAVIFYNKFVNDINSISNRVEDFGHELQTMLSREMEKK